MHALVIQVPLNCGAGEQMGSQGGTVLWLLSQHGLHGLSLAVGILGAMSVNRKEGK